MSEQIDWSRYMTVSKKSYTDLQAQVAALQQQVRDYDALARGLLPLISGWREVIAEIDDLAKSEVLGSAMWACLDQIDAILPRLSALTSPDTGSDLSGEQKEALDNWLMLAALREAYTQLHDLHHKTSKSWDIEFAQCSLWVCRKNREKLLGWGVDVTAITPDTGSGHEYRPSSDLINSPCAVCRQRPDDHDDTGSEE